MDEKFLETAAALSLGEIEAGIERARRRAPKPVNFTGQCECGEDVPKGRQDLGLFNCVACQKALETRHKHFR